jgi:hypothetical protein
MLDRGFPLIRPAVLGAEVAEICTIGTVGALGVLTAGLARGVSVRGVTGVPAFPVALFGIC